MPDYSHQTSPTNLTGGHSARRQRLPSVLISVSILAALLLTFIPAEIVAATPGHGRASSHSSAADHPGANNSNGNSRHHRQDSRREHGYQKSRLGENGGHNQRKQTGNQEVKETESQSRQTPRQRPDHLSPQTAPTQSNGAQKVTICHRTNSAKNPYVQITVSVAAVDGSTHNHGGHIGSIYDPAVHNQQHRGWGDIIPPVAGRTDGANWPAGKATWESGCQAARIRIAAASDPQPAPDREPAQEPKSEPEEEADETSTVAGDDDRPDRLVATGPGYAQLIASLIMSMSLGFCLQAAYTRRYALIQLARQQITR